MGLLDDAIRQHLELKRLRGEDPAEIDRAEREALGPVRRSPEAPEQEDIAAHPGVEEPSESFDGEADYVGDGVEYADEGVEELKPEYEPEGLPANDPGVHEQAVEPAPEPPPPDQAAEPAPEPPPPHPATASTPPSETPHTPAEHLDQETVEYDVEEERDRQGEDMLEETPEFLQDTPEHDRLWFEQRPPRDFDFEG